MNDIINPGTPADEAGVNPIATSAPGDDTKLAQLEGVYAKAAADEDEKSVAKPLVPPPKFDEAYFRFNDPPRFKGDVFTFRTYSDAQICLRMMAMGHLKMPTDITPERQLHMVIGKAVETLLKRLRKNTLGSVEEGYEITEQFLALLPAHEHPFALKRITEFVARGLALDARAEQAHEASQTRRNRRVAQQFYAPITVKTMRGEETFRLPAKPDLTEFIGYVEGSGIAPETIVILDDKTAGKVRAQTADFLKWFGLVVSLWAQRKIESGEWQLKPHQKKRRRGYHLKRHRAKAATIPIEYAAQLLGEKRDRFGRLVEAQQPKTTRYSQRLEESHLNHVKHVIKRVMEAFEANYFPPTPSAECQSCPFKAGCAGYASWAIEHPETPKSFKSHGRSQRRSHRHRRFGRPMRDPAPEVAA